MVDCDLDEASNPDQSPSSSTHILMAMRSVCVSRESQGLFFNPEGCLLYNRAGIEFAVRLEYCEVRFQWQN